MEQASWWLGLCALGLLAAPCGGTGPCVYGFTFNVILLDDDWSSWSLKYVKGEILKAIEKEKALNSEGKTSERCSHRYDKKLITDQNFNCVVLQNKSQKHCCNSILR